MRSRIDPSKLKVAAGLLLAVFTITACGGSESASSSPSAPPVSPAPPPPPPPPVNQSPVLSGDPAASVLVGLNYDFLPAASDPEGDPLVFSATGLPGWAIFDSDDGRLTGMPEETDAGLYEGIEIHVSDGTNTTSLGPFSISVELPSFGLETRPSNTSCLAVPAPDDATISLQPAFPNLALSGLTALTQAPGVDDAWYFATRDGVIGRFDNDDAVSSASTVLDLTDTVIEIPDGGLIQVVFHHDFPNDRRFFVNYSTAPQDASWLADFVIASFELSADGLTASRQSEVVVLRQPRRNNHQGGMLTFDANGLLLVGMGDGTAQGDPDGLAQDTTELRGKILRLDVDSLPPYLIPPGNPFVDANDGVRDEIFAIGLRNPYRGDVDPETGQIFVADVGFRDREEVSEVFAGANLGWNIKEATSCHSEVYGSCDDPELVDPLVEYSHENGNCAVIGGYFYRGDAIPSLQGRYVFADFCTAKISAVDFQQNGSPFEQPLLSGGSGIGFVNTFGKDNSGELYAVTDGQIFKIAAEEAQGGSPGPASTLSQTGCFEITDASLPTPGLIPYDLNSELWSDSADKRRWIALPDDRSIDIGPDGDFSFPEGTVLAKEFSIDGERIETRLMMKDVNGLWGGYSYEWDGDDALLLPAGKQKQLPNGQTWRYPDRGECFRCHTDAAGFALGPELSQLNRSLTYPQTNLKANQLATLEHIGMLTSGLPDDPDQLDVLAGIDDLHHAAARRARGYLHSNCAGCHRGEGPTQSTMDLRYQASRVDMNVCNMAPLLGDMGIATAKLLDPGSPSTSLLVQRPASTNPLWRMPPLGTSIVHDDAIALLAEWVLSPQACAPESDADLDRVPDDVDNCPTDSNPDQADSDRDSVGDVCDTD